MKIEYSVITGFLGKLQDRFTQYQEKRSLEEKFALASQIKGLKGLEVIFPSDFQDKEKLKQLLETYKLKVSAVNVNLKGEERWKGGSLTSNDANIRKQAIDVLKEAMDLASELECKMITVAFLNDGHDYPFQREYTKAWDNLVSGLREVADYRKDVRLSVEYKMNEPAVRTTVGNVGKGLCLCSEVERDNVGITLDVGHALYAGENPAESASLLAKKGKLFYLHLNDNFRNWDWDLIPGYVNLWDYLELFFYLKKFNYQGWIALDVFPKSLDPVAVFTTSIQFARNIESLVEKIDQKEIFELMKKNDVPSIFSYLQERILNLK